MAKWRSTCNHNYLYRWLPCQYFILLMMGAWRLKHVEKVCSNKSASCCITSRSQILTFLPCAELFYCGIMPKGSVWPTSLHMNATNCRQSIDLCYNSYCLSADRSPSPSGSPQSSPRPSPRQHHRRDHSKGEIPVGSCKENSPLDKSDILEVSNSVCLFVSSDWGNWVNCSALYSHTSLCSVATTHYHNSEMSPRSTFVLCHAVFIFIAQWKFVHLQMWINQINWEELRKNMRKVFMRKANQDCRLMYNNRVHRSF